MWRRWLPSAVLLSAVIGGRQLVAQADSSCHVVRQSGPAPDKIVVGVTDSADNGDQASPFVQGLFFEPLVRRDCTGRLIPGLAAKWTSIASGLTFTIRSGAKFA